MSSHHSVTNPNSPFDNYVSGNISGTQINAPLFPQNTGGDRSSMESLGEFGELRRLSVVDFVSSLRPARLIGTVLPLCTWKIILNLILTK